MPGFQSRKKKGSWCSGKSKSSPSHGLRIENSKDIFFFPSANPTKVSRKFFTYPTKVSRIPKKGKRRPVARTLRFSFLGIRLTLVGKVSVHGYFTRIKLYPSTIRAGFDGNKSDKVIRGYQKVPALRFSFLGIRAMNPTNFSRDWRANPTTVNRRSQQTAASNKQFKNSNNQQEITIYYIIVSQRTIFKASA